jgi:hypothetical protein
MTFHRAIDMASDIYKAADTVRDLGRLGVVTLSMCVMVFIYCIMSIHVCEKGWVKKWPVNWKICWENKKKEVKK